MSDPNWVLLTKVPDLIMRGALVARMGESQIEAYVPERDMIVNLGSEPNLSLEGYSAVFDGYEVYVNQSDLDRAKVILKEIESQFYVPSSEPVNYANKFYFAAVMSVLLPGVLHLVALYNLIQVFKFKQRLRLVKTLFCSVVMISSFLMLFTLIRSFLDQL